MFCCDSTGLRRRHHLGHLVTYGEGLHLPNLCRSCLRWSAPGPGDWRFHSSEPVPLVALGRLDDSDHLRRGFGNYRFFPAGNLPADITQMEGKALA